MRRLIWFILFTGLQSLSQAIVFQDNGSIITGIVTDVKGSPLAGAGITIENTLLGVYADSDGNYALPGLKDGDYLLRFSYVGYESQFHEVLLKGDTVLNIVLIAKSIMTEEVFVNATRAGKYSPMTYSTITRDDISKNNIVQDIPYLLNYTPSLVVSSDAGTGVGYTYINIRGTDVKRINVTIDGIPVNDAESHGVW